MEFRHLTKDDFKKKYLNLLEQLTIVNKELIDETVFSYFLNTLDLEKKVVFVMEDDSKIIASGTLIIEQKLIHGASKLGHIEDIVVDKTYRGMGLGKKLISFLIDYAKKKNCYKVTLDCNIKNKLFYEKCDLKYNGCQMVKYLK